MRLWHWQSDALTTRLVLILTLPDLIHKNKNKYSPLSSVADPDPNPYVFGHPGSGSDPLVRGMDPDPSITNQK
jgi:hypothetical protein